MELDGGSGVDDVVTTASARLSRRDALKRAAIVGGAVWAVPAVQVVSMGRAGAQPLSPVPPPPPMGSTTTTTTAAPTCKAISNIQIVVSKTNPSGTKYFGLKFDPEDSNTFTAWHSAAPDSNDCIRYWETQTGNTVLAKEEVAALFNGETTLPAAVVDVIGECEWRLRLPLPDNFVYVAGYVKSGNVGVIGCPPAGAPTASYVPFVGAPV